MGGQLKKDCYKGGSSMSSARLFLRKFDLNRWGEVSPGAAGLRDNPSQSDFTIDTRFHVGSLSKSLLATGVLRLATEGLILT
jgi:hypothetical protein